MLRHLCPTLLNPHLNTTGPGRNRSIPWNTRSQLHIMRIPNRNTMRLSSILKITTGSMPQYSLLI